MKDWQRQYGIAQNGPRGFDLIAIYYEFLKIDLFLTEAVENPTDFRYSKG